MKKVMVLLVVAVFFSGCNFDVGDVFTFGNSRFQVTSPLVYGPKVGVVATAFCEAQGRPKIIVTSEQDISVEYEQSDLSAYSGVFPKEVIAYIGHLRIPIKSNGDGNVLAVRGKDLPNDWGVLINPAPSWIVKGENGLDAKYAPDQYTFFWVTLFGPSSQRKLSGEVVRILDNGTPSLELYQIRDNNIDPYSLSRTEKAALESFEIVRRTNSSVYFQEFILDIPEGIGTNQVSMEWNGGRAELLSVESGDLFHIAKITVMPVMPASNTSILIENRWAEWIGTRTPVLAAPDKMPQFVVRNGKAVFQLSPGVSVSMPEEKLEEMLKDGPQFLAIQPHGKFATTWGALKK